jgi:hypothetical protein
MPAGLRHAARSAAAANAAGSGRESPLAPDGCGDVEVRRAFTTPQGRWKPITADGIELLDLQTVPVSRYRYRGGTIPSPWVLNHA